MLFISVEDFYRQATAISSLPREQAVECMRMAAQGDCEARERWVRRQMPLVAAVIGRAPSSIQTLHTVYAAMAVVEHCADALVGEPDYKAVMHRLNWGLRQCLCRCLATC